MKKLISATALLIIMSLSAQAQTPLVKYGIELGFLANIYNNTQLNYISAEGYRVDDSSSGACFIGELNIMGSVGLNVSKCIDLSLWSGYMNRNKNGGSIPLLLRMGYHFKSIDSDGLFAFVDGGVGFHLRKEDEPGRKPAILADAGIGYRFVLTHRSSGDLFFKLKGSFDSRLVPDPDNGGYIPESNIRKNSEFYLAPGIGIIINF